MLNRHSQSRELLGQNVKGNFTIRRKARKGFKSIRFDFLKLNEMRPALQGWHILRGTCLFSITRWPVKPSNFNDINGELG
jgi:hypothetical protein